MFHGIFIETPLHNVFFKYQIQKSWYLTPCCGLEVQKPTRALKSVKDTDNAFHLSPKWARTLPSLIHLLCVIHRLPPPPNLNIKVVYRDSSRHISGGAKGSGTLRMRYWKWHHRKRPWPEMTSHDRKWRHNRKYFLRMPGSTFTRFLSYYSSSTKCTIAHDRK
jgi:hypothetical protein